MGYIAKNLGIKIKELRECNNLTQQKMAELINMESSNLSKIERGIQIPKEESLENIVSILKVDIKEMFDFSHIKPKEHLVENIITIIKSSSIEELQAYYKIINSLRELTKKK